MRPKICGRSSHFFVDITYLFLLMSGMSCWQVFISVMLCIMNSYDLRLSPHLPSRNKHASSATIFTWLLQMFLYPKLKPTLKEWQLRQSKILRTSCWWTYMHSQNMHARPAWRSHNSVGSGASVQNGTLKTKRLARS